LVAAERAGLSKALVWDYEPAAGSWRGGKPVLSEEFAAFRGSLGIRVIQCRPRDPEAKRLVERINGYLETSFLPGRMFQDPHDFNRQLEDWLKRANQRRHRIIECRPRKRLGEDRAAMVALPPRILALGWRWSTRLPQDPYVRVQTGDYSVHPARLAVEST
jgi:hypothetical protein